MLLLIAVAACGPVPTNATKTTEPTQQQQGAEPSRPPEPQPQPHEPGPPPRPGLSVSSIAVAASAQADAVLYTLTCGDCVLPGEDATQTVPADAVTASVRGYTARNGAHANPLYEASGRHGQIEVVAAVASGDVVWTLLADEKNALKAVGLAPAGSVVPGGSVISAAVSGGRQTQGASFGTMVRNGLALPADGGGAHFLVMSADGLAAVLVGTDGTAQATVIAPPEASVAAIARAGDHLAVAYSTKSEGGLDTPVTVDLGGGVPPVTSPIAGAPAALWSNGAEFKVVIKKADSIAALWDGTTVTALPRSDEAACTAVAFSNAGELAMLSAGPQSAVLYSVLNGALTAPRLLSIRDRAGPATTACAASFGAAFLHVAWSEDLTFIQHQMIDFKTGRAELRTRHDTVKNSIGNVR
ncbi:MAG: hypothetical protein IT381_28695 [Deltaproteobacteria bacterium]|nr:hypothetical protein [Deltaproteobacteria bacterium]